jgi:cytochrome c oxidase assembly protein subunit 15
LIASTVGFLILALAVWLRLADPRTWVRRLGYVALAAVVTQGILGGITVLWFLPTPVSVAHAGLAQIVFCLTTAIALVTSKGWARAYGAGAPVSDDRIMRRLAAGTVGLVYGQILVGAVMRHSGAGLAIPDFPLAFGALVPPQWDAGIAIHFAHRVGALLVALTILALAGHVLAHHRARLELRRPALLLLALVAAQITLGAYTVLSGKHYIVNSLHVVTGATVLVTSLVVALRVFRGLFPEATGLDATDRGTDPTYAAGARARA